ncbi:cyclase family protein, partial [Streptosporangium algeriense]
MTRLIELSHRITEGMRTYPGVPGPRLGVHLSREASREVYAPGTEFHIGTVELAANTGTYLDTPYHRYPDGPDLSGVPLEAVADLPGLVVRAEGPRA